MITCISLTVFTRGGLVVEKVWTEADLRGGTPAFLAGDGCNGETTSTFEVLLTAAMVAGMLSIGFTSLTDACLQCNNINYNLIRTYIMVHMYNFAKKYLYRETFVCNKDQQGILIVP